MVNDGIKALDGWNKVILIPTTFLDHFPVICLNSLVDPKQPDFELARFMVKKQFRSLISAL